MSGLEPIAIVGMACRFAGGVDSLEKFWALLCDGRDTIGDLPGDRWQWYAAQGREHEAALRDVTKRGAFLDDVKGFDADFFGITPREAALMDPQQRMVLELSWEALEHAGIRPPDLAGTDAGVFMGVGADDYGRRLLEDLPRVEAWTGIGGAYCAVANRVSYTLDFRGPSLSVDTACSSSLVAVHLAVQALRAGECPVALAGGVLVIAAPGLSLVLDAAGATAPDGRSKSFDASADGYGRGEGGGVIVLKRLGDAHRDGDRVLAVIRGSAVHQDGRTNGIMAPSGQAQAHLMRRTYAAAGIDPATVQYVEAHGTGTRIGDPLEAGAMASVFGGRGAGQPLLIGSVKTNIGHLEAGAGVAGVIKTVLAMRHGRIPPSLNLTTPNPAIPWGTSGLRVVTETVPWPQGGPRRAGVSAYGYGGTIAHVILEARDETGEMDRVGDHGTGPRLYPLSAASRAALDDHAARLAEHLARHPETDLADIGHTLARRRTHLPHRVAVLARDRAELIARLREPAEPGTPLPGAQRGPVWVFSGHGSQWAGMGRQSLTGDAAFAKVIDHLEPVFLEEIGFSPRAALFEDGPHPVDVIQPMIFAMQVALAASWLALGLRPSAVIGHSVGEIAAAVTAGVLSLDDGARLVCRRSVLLRKVAGNGAMAMVGLPAALVAQRLGDRHDVAVAVSAAPESTVISGSAAAIEELSERWLDEGISVRRVDSDVAFHSGQMDPLLEALAAAATGLPPRPPDIPLYTTALADPRSTAPRDGAYWAANLRHRVRFAEAVTAAAEDGYRVFLEISPHPVVEHSILETLDGLGITDGYPTHSLRRHQPERDTLLTSLGRLFCVGVPVDWSALWPTGTLTDLPTTAWQHRPHWCDEPPARTPATERHDPASLTLLGGRSNVRGTTPARVWATYLDRESRPYPGDHPVRGVEIVPAAVLLNTFLTVARSAGSPADLTDISLRVPVSVTTPRYLQIVEQDRAIRLSSRMAEDSSDDLGWLTHTTAVIAPPSSSDTGFAADPVTDEELPPSHVVDRLATLGVAGMGLPWTVQRVRSGDGTLVTTVGTDATTSWAPVLDAALSAASVVFPGPPVLRMPAHIERLSLAAHPPRGARVAVTIRGDDTVDVRICDLDGVVRGRLSGLRYGALDRDPGAVANPRRLVHELAWQPMERPGAAVPPRVVLIGPGSRLREALTRHLDEAGVAHRVVATPRDLHEADLSGEHVLLVVPPPATADDVSEAAARSAWLLARTAQRLAGSGSPSPARLWCVTQGVRESADERSLGQAALWGLGRVIGGEHPEFWGGVVDIGRSPWDPGVLLDVVCAVRGEDVIAVRDGLPSVARLRHVEGEPARAPLTCRPDGTYLVTGGLGALGLEVARWLADRGARRIVLAGRSALPSRDGWDTVADDEVRARVEAIRALERAGVTVVTVALDVADPQAAEKLLSTAALGLPPIRGVVHAAGVLDNRMLRGLDEDSLRKVLRPKVNAALVLHALFPPGSVDFFVLFSSCGQLLGLPGQASYAAGNAFLDALAAHRRAAGDTGTMSLGWTSWRGLGMSTSSEVIDVELAARGTGDIGATEAFGAWELAARHGLGYAAVLRTLPPEPGETRLPLLGEIRVEPPADRADAETQDAPWSGVDGPELRRILTDEIGRHVAAETRLAASEVDPRRPLTEMGVDSVMTVRIRRALERRFRLSLPATLLWDRPTIDAVAALLSERLAHHEA